MNAPKRGRGRPRLAEGEARSVVLRIRLTPAEAEAVRAAADVAGAPTVAAYVVRRLFGR